MNKLMIMLGLLLIAGLSFAGPTPSSWQYDWQNYVSWRYTCNYGDVALGQYDLAANYMYVYAQPYVQYSQISSMSNYLFYMGMANNWMMMADYYPSEFRVDMNAYNSNNGAFRAIFNAVLRTYLQHGGDRTYVLGMLNGFNSDYMDCVADGPWFAEAEVE